MEYELSTTFCALVTGWATTNKLCEISEKELIDTSQDEVFSTESTTALEEIYEVSIDIPVLYFWSFGIVSFMGILFNCVSFVTLTGAYAKSSMFFVLRALAVIDFTLILNVFIQYFVVRTYKLFAPVTDVFEDIQHYGGRIMVAIWPFLMISQTCSIWMTVLLSIERFIAVCFPMKRMHLLAPKRIKLAVAIICVFGVVYNIPRFLEVNYVSYKAVAAWNWRSSFGSNHLYIFIYTTIMYIIFSYLIPFTVLAILSLKITLALRKARKRWASEKINHIPSRDKREHQFAVYQLGIVVLFLICSSPAMITHILQVFLPNFVFTNPFYVHWILIANGFVFLNSTLNFFVYFFLIKRFRKQLYELFFIRCSKKC